jgi:hypothetical protein
VTAALSIRNREVNAPKITATALGGPAHFAVKSVGGKGVEQRADRDG